MKSFFYMLTAAILISAGISAASNAQQKSQAAQQQGGSQLIIAFVDNKFMLENAAVFKDINRQVLKYRGAIQSDIRREEETLRKASDDLKQKRQVLSSDAFNLEREKYQDSVAALQARVDRIQKEFARSEQKMLGKVRDAVNQIFKEVAKELNLILILRRRDLIFGHPSLDITSHIIQRLDKQLPKLSVPDPRK
ncbi:MAG: OmpH family outer membrane protein [Rhodospirillales bacterium]